jgi:hypothetical protein
MNYELVVWSFGRLVVLTKTLITPVNGISLSDFRSSSSATAIYELTMMYWHIGERINREVLDNQRAEYGKQIVASVARQLQKEYGSKGFDEKSIRRMMQFAQEFPKEQIVSQAATLLTWLHFSGV